MSASLFGWQIYNLFTTEMKALTKKNFNCIDFEVFCVFANQTADKLRIIKI